MTKSMVSALNLVFMLRFWDLVPIRRSHLLQSCSLTLLNVMPSCAFGLGILNEIPVSVPSMARAFGVPGSTLESNWVTTIKTHKGNGLIEHRNIHAASCPKLRGLSFWATQVLDGHLRLCSHLLLSSEDFAQRLATLRIGVDDRLVRIDHSHFFMSGDLVSLSDGASIVEPCASKRALMRATLDVLLYEQFITSKHHVGRTWRVVKGSGMGLTHSSAVVDCCLFTLAEKNWAVCPDVQLAHGVKMFVRLRDDIFTVASDLA